MYPGIFLLLLAFASTGSAQRGGRTTFKGRSFGVPKDKPKSQYAHTDWGRPYPSLTAVQRVGRHGPLTLKDANFIEHLAHFDRERIPERVVHAKGFGAHGEFEATNDISMYTKACLFKPGTRTKMTVRFSTVVGERGSPDTMQDTHGFALKFYTDCGNWDVVGNNKEVFPIRDPMLFPSLIHSRKRNPQTGLPDANRFWDFSGLRAETTMHTLWLMSYLAFPDTARHMDGSSVHSFKCVNATGHAVYCKFSYISAQGLKNVTMEENNRRSGADPDYYTRDLFNAIAEGQYPAWDFYIQTMTFEEAAEVPFNPFDTTKYWPRDDFPLQPVGRFVLNENPVNYFNEIEMAAFSPAHMIPGIEPSPDPMLQGRMFSYTDSQRWRLGVNFRQLPVNRPKNWENMHTYSYDGKCNIAMPFTGPNYFPNSFGGPGVDPDAYEHVDHVTGDVVRADRGEEDNFSQAKLWYQSRPDDEKLVIAHNLGHALSGVTNDQVRERVIGNMEQVDPELGVKIRAVIASIVAAKK